MRTGIGIRFGLSGKIKLSRHFRMGDRTMKPYASCLKCSTTFKPIYYCLRHFIKICIEHFGCQNFNPSMSCKLRLEWPICNSSSVWTLEGVIHTSLKTAFAFTLFIPPHDGMTRGNECRDLREKYVVLLDYYVTHVFPCFGATTVACSVISALLPS
jgi:hypothetical protein